MQNFLKNRAVHNSTKVPDREISLAELESHDGSSANSTRPQWTAIYGLVYEISSWADQHPGGYKMMQIVSGRDASYMFEASHPSNAQLHKALSIIANEKHGIKLIGKLKPSATDAQCQCGAHDPSKAPKTGYNEFYDTLRHRVNAFMRENHYSFHECGTHLASFVFYMDIVLSFVCFIASSLAMMYKYNGSNLISCAFAAINGASRARLGLLMHSGWHRAYAYNIVNDFCGSFIDLIGANSDMWLLKHQVLHHLAPNTTDIDFNVRNSIFLRFHPKNHLKYIHRWQFMYVPVLMALFGVLQICQVSLNALMYTMNYPLFRLYGNNLNMFGIWRFLVGKLLFFGLLLPLKWYLVDPSSASDSVLTISVMLEH
jgi:hypothetical protein